MYSIRDDDHETRRYDEGTLESVPSLGREDSRRTRTDVDCLTDYMRERR
jgi:hypothetical protein